jgi:type VI secretion system secreted protein Hcp
MIWRCYVTITGARGRFRGEVGDPKNGRMALTGYASALRSPRDAATAAGGRRQHQPLTLVKEVGAATPQLAQAACTGEVLRTVTCEFMRFADGGVEELLFVVNLSDATISGHRIALAPAESGQALREEIDLTYRRIEWEHRVAKTMAADEWA